MRTIAALFVEPAPHGVYQHLEGVEAWDVEKDARLYRGPYPVVAHPPCKRWGRYWSGGPSAKVPRLKGDDNDCFAAALRCVRHFGGVIEHPEASHAWSWFGLERPTRKGGWTDADQYGGRSCCVEQGAYGHKARKATWLYAVDAVPAELKWVSSKPHIRLDSGYHSSKERREKYKPPVKRLTIREKLDTPIEFRDLLIYLARSVYDIRK